MTGVTVPLWVGVLMFLGTLGAALIAGVFLLKGKRVDGPQAALNAILTNAPALLGKAQELINANELLQRQIRERDESVDDLTGRVDVLTEKVTSLEAQCEALTRKASRVPALEKENAGLRRHLAEKEAELERAVIERDTALRAQERAEGGLASATRTIADLCPGGS